MSELTEEQDTEQRTTPLGFFHNAQSYWLAAEALEKANVSSTHADSPIRFLYYHAIELYLKCLLRLHGHSVYELGSNRKFGHDYARLAERAVQLGLKLDGEDTHILNLIAKTDAVIRSRYHKTGAFYWPTLDGLDRVCSRLNPQIRDALRGAGFPVR